MRARNLKPGFFTNPELAACDYAARLLFAGLWCAADREGRLCDRPAKLHLEVFPGDTDVDVEDLLQQLAEQQLINRYEVSGLRIIEIPTFAKHQRPHHREKPSELPPSQPQADEDGLSGRVMGDTIGTAEPAAEPPAAADRVPVQASLPDMQLAGVPSQPRLPKEDIAQAWQSICVPAGAAAFYEWTPARVKKLRTRCREDRRRFDPAWWRELFARVARSGFLTGQSSGGFRASLSWVLERENLLRILEGAYDGGQQLAGVPQGVASAIERELALVERAIRGDRRHVSEDPITVEVVAGMGGYQALGRAPAADLQRNLRAFRDAYAARAQAEVAA